MRVGVVLTAGETMGGAFNQSLRIARLVKSAATDCDITYLAFDRGDVTKLREFGIEVGATGGGLIRKADLVLRYMPPMRRALRSVYSKMRFLETDLDALAAKNGYDAYVFTSPSRLVYRTRRTPFIYTVWDLCHRDHPEFPEIAGDGSFAWRENLYRDALPRASGYIVDNTMLADRLAQHYGAERSRAAIVPLYVAPELREAPANEQALAALRTKHGLTRPFVFYPAQFWPHKNHAYILRGLQALHARGTQVDAVFCGSDHGTKSHIKDLAHKLRIADQVKFLGFLPIAEVAQLYRSAIALVMPSYFGPTNIPPLEAAALGCHLIYSDLPGYRDVGGTEAQYCDLNNPDDLAHCIENAMTLPKRPMAPKDLRDPAPEVRRLLQEARNKLLTWRDFN
jgi:glycosyltransferase involved in cell wall biosynthesis